MIETRARVTAVTDSSYIDRYAVRGALEVPFMRPLLWSALALVLLLSVPILQAQQPDVTTIYPTFTDN